MKDPTTRLRSTKTGAGFDRILIRPHFLRNDVSAIDTSTALFGRRLTHPIYLSITGGKNCFVPNGERETILAAATSNSMLITSGGNSGILSASKRPTVWWQFTTAAEFRSRNQMLDFTERLEDQGCSGVSVTVDIYHVSHGSAASTTCSSLAERATIPTDRSSKPIFLYSKETACKMCHNN